MKSSTPPRTAWLFPSLQNGNYWHPVLAEYSKLFPETTVFTGYWPGFSPGFENTFNIEVLDETKFIATANPDGGYSRSYILPSIGIVEKLVRYRPDIIFTSAFSLWTVFSLLFKPIFNWKVVILFDGVSTRLDYLNSGSRVIVRRAMARFVDAFVANSQAGKTYLTEVIGMPENKIFNGVYLVPNIKALSASDIVNEEIKSSLGSPVFLYVGQIVSRKGVQQLLEACSLLKKQSDQDFKVVVVGDGAQKAELEELTQSRGLQNIVQWTGKVEYHQLGTYFKQADVFVFPTLEDIWGMVPLEAMAFGKPVICSKWAGSADVIRDGENGYIVDPIEIESLAKKMQQFIDCPETVVSMGKRSQELIQAYTSEAVSVFFRQITDSLILGE